MPWMYNLCGTFWCSKGLTVEIFYLLFSESPAGGAGGGVSACVCRFAAGSVFSELWAFLLAAFVPAICSRVVWVFTGKKKDVFKSKNLQTHHFSRFYQHETSAYQRSGGDDGTLVLGLGARGLSTGLLLGFPPELLSWAAFLLDVMLSRMFVTRGWPAEADGFPEPGTWKWKG